MKTKVNITNLINTSKRNRLSSEQFYSLLINYYKFTVIHVLDILDRY